MRIKSIAASTVFDHPVLFAQHKCENFEGVSLALRVAFRQSTDGVFLEEP